MGIFRRKKDAAVMENRFKSPETSRPSAQPESSSTQQEQSSKSSKSKRKLTANPIIGLRKLLDGSLLTNEYVVNNIPLILFITALAIAYITNTSTAEKNRRELVNLTEELKELRYKYISTKSGVMFLSNQSQISKRLKETGIKENTVPPVKIFIPKENTQKQAHTWKSRRETY